MMKNSVCIEDVIARQSKQIHNAIRFGRGETNFVIVSKNTIQRNEKFVLPPLCSKIITLSPDPIFSRWKNGKSNRSLRSPNFFPSKTPAKNKVYRVFSIFFYGMREKKSSFFSDKLLRVIRDERLKDFYCIVRT